jgi:methylase of polypeptide subunit release factors
MRYSQSPTLAYLKRHVLSDERIVNRLFVSAFIEAKGMEYPQKTFLANYIIKRNDVDYSMLVEVSKRLTTEYGNRIDLETLVQLFEFVVSPADRVVTGAVYTPKRIRNAIISNCIGDKTIDNLWTIRIADISCGCGGFLMDMAQLIHQKTGKAYVDIFKENIYGIDIEAYAIERTKILLSIMALLEGEDSDFSFNLLCRDTLDFKDEDWNEHYRDFDIIVGNPPYVCSRNLTLETRKKLKDYKVCGSGHPDLYIPFFQIAVEMLANDGMLGFITMNTFLRSVNGRSLRRFFSDNHYAISIVDFRGYQIFESKNTYTCLFYLKKKIKAEGVDYKVDEQGSLSENVEYTNIPYRKLDDNKGWTLNDFETTIAIETTGVQIKDYCPSRHGIATLSNETYIFKPVEEDDRFFYLKCDNIKYPIERGICRDVVNPNKLNTVDDLDSLIEKVVFPYRIEDGRAIAVEQEIMQKKYPCAWAYLNAKKKILLKRDKEKTQCYPQWYAFGRTQSLVLPRYKLFFPKFADRPIRCVIRDDAELMLYNGLAFVNSDARKLYILKAVIESKLFWNYIRTNGKPYSSGYYSLSGVDIKHFGIPLLSKEEEDELLSLTNKEEIEHWLRNRYN